MRSENLITHDTIICRKNDQVFSKIDNEIVMLSIKNGEYYNLNETGTIIWSALEKHITVQDLIDILYNEFDVPKSTCESETKVFLSELLERGLISISDE